MPALPTATAVAKVAQYINACRFCLATHYSPAQTEIPRPPGSFKCIKCLPGSTIFWPDPFVLLISWPGPTRPHPLSALNCMLTEAWSTWKTLSFRMLKEYVVLTISNDLIIAQR